MNRRKMIALFLVLALTGSALALQQQKVYKEDNGDPRAEGVVAVQQHSVFVELIVEQNDTVRQEHKFAAVVGLVKECKEVRNVFDNAVLWFNDQFLFGTKANNRTNVTSDFGFNPNRSHNLSNPDDPGFVRAQDNQERWGGCFIPNGFIHAIGQDDPYGLEQGVDADAGGTGEPGTVAAGGDGIGFVKNLIRQDNACNGCIFEYSGTFYITDPNGHGWMVDKTLYPVSFEGDLFQSSGECDEGNFLGIQEPTDNHHCDRAEDDGSAPPNADNHCFDGDAECDGSGSHDSHKVAGMTLREPLFSVHVQVDPDTRQGFADEAIWAYDSGDLREGMPRYENADTPNYEPCRTLNDGTQCAIEYNFLIAVDFDSFDDFGIDVEETNTNSNVSSQGENEIIADGKEHGFQGADNGDQAWQGNSHPHNPNDDHYTPADTDGDGVNETCVEASNGIPDVQDTIDLDGDGTEGEADANNDGVRDDAENCLNAMNPRHKHDVVLLDMFFFDQAPWYIEQNPYWDEFGGPPTWDDQCENAAGTPSDTQRAAVTARIPVVCDVTADDGFHTHDGSQTPNPS